MHCTPADCERAALQIFKALKNAKPSGTYKRNRTRERLFILGVENV